MTSAVLTPAARSDRRIAPTVGGVELSDGTRVAANQKVGGAPSVLYDAVAVLPSETAVTPLLKQAPALQFVMDAFAHLKFILYSPAAMALFEKANLAAMLDEGCVEASGSKSAAAFVKTCRTLRYWPRAETIQA